MELPLVSLGKPLGFTEKQVMGPFALAHYPNPLRQWARKGARG
jgi:hypothetical protein